MKAYCIISIGLILTALSIHTACESVCEPDFQDLDNCSCPDKAGDVLFITGFENGKNPTEGGGGLGIWQDTFSDIRVFAFYATDGGGAGNSPYYAKLVIQGNKKNSATGWSGGGLVLNLSDCIKGLDLSEYDLLQFDIKTFPGSSLNYTNIKLEGATIEQIENDSTPERKISRFGVFPSSEWKTVSVPLDSFNIIRHTDTAFYRWTPFDRGHALKLVTTTINDFSDDGLDGVLGIDNVRIVKY